MTGPTEDTQKAFFESDAGDGTRREEMYLEGKKLVLCFVAIFFCFFLFALDQTIIATLLTTVGNKFNAFDKIGWISAGFLISMAVLVAVWGKLSIIFGRKVTMMAAIILFEAGSLMCALANSMNVLIGGRVLAGIGGGGIQSITFIIGTEILPIQKRPIAMAILSTVFAVASVLGPLIGGAFTSHVSWRWCFYINLPVGGAAFSLFVLVYNPPKAKGSIRQKLKLIDYPGVILLSAGLVVFLLALTFGAGGQYAWNSAAVIACFVVGGVVSIIFFVWNVRFSKHPMLPWEVLRVFQVEASAFALFGAYASFISAVLYLSVYFQVIHDADAWESGVHLLPLIIAVVVVSFASAIISKVTRYVKPFAVFGAFLGMVGAGLLCLLEVDSSSSRKIGLLIPMGLGIGFLMQACMLSGQISAPKTPGGTILATVLVNFMRSFGGALSSNLADAVYSASYLNKVHENLKKQPEEVIKELSTIDVRAIVSSTAAIAKLSAPAQKFLKHQVMSAIRNTFYMNLGFSAIAVIAVCFITNKRLPDASVQERDEKITETKPAENDSAEPTRSGTAK
ncbi:putative basic amino acid transporter [Clavispora lusitaniae]|uniref:Basic amino acid transporter n=1 Tax=Clavispora lusitaniae TaxID=36911 RepID=A0AA91Q412_CLALS|nr:putative basic amino acid transporter [Clavispora lusitaniae]